MPILLGRNIPKGNPDEIKNILALWHPQPTESVSTENRFYFRLELFFRSAELLITNLDVTLDHNVGLSEDDACVSSPCGNGATCHDLLARYVCECAENYHGKNCQLEVPQRTDLNTSGVSSVNGSTMTSDNVTCPSCPTCTEVSTVVPEPITHCPTPEPDVDYCADGPCQHGGSCYNLMEGYLCACAEGFTDDNCSAGNFLTIYLSETGLKSLTLFFCKKKTSQLSLFFHS